MTAPDNADKLTSGEVGFVFEVVISGGGAAGLSLAICLKRTLGARFGVMVLDPSSGSRESSVRTSALAAGSRNLLHAIGVWSKLESKAQPILGMRITDSRRNDAVRPVFLDFEEPLETGEPFAHMIRNRDLVDLLSEQAMSEGVEIAPTAVTRLSFQPGWVDIATKEQRSLRAKLVVGADGAQSRIRRACGIETVGREYGRSAIVATLAHEQDHGGFATQHFLPTGPFAMLPLCGRRSSIVWTERHEDARGFASLAEDDFLAEVERRFGRSLGRFSLEEGPSTFPLRVHIARRFIARRAALIGDAAHLTHPLAGQGLNLGLRDVAALTGAVAKQVRLGLDAGAEAVLEEYQRARFFDTASMLAGTDGLHRLFSNDSTLVRLVRDVGLGVVNRMPRLKRTFVNEAAGLRGEVPSLLRGRLP